ncbi:hypothetical protein [Stenotrophomonas sp. AB1(2024)]|jgi:hypothetical protein|uniref:hypothetical protein n=1 Tax=Stenotrophomonas sp. AB1(2024) TaxID=3132215 RepID=UPI0030AD31A9
MKRYLTTLPLLALLACAGAHADTLLIDRTKEQAAPVVPVRGQTASQVLSTFGEPSEKLEPRGGQKRQWPTINRWVYPMFTVYFEKQKVIDVVANKAAANEVGPKPPIR